MQTNKLLVTISILLLASCAANKKDSISQLSTCEITNEHRCAQEIWGKLNEFKKSFYNNYYQYLFAGKINVSIQVNLKFKICPDGQVVNVSITEKKNVYDNNFDKLLLNDFNKFNFGKKDMKDSMDCVLPIIFP
jgi:hypothetical protein